MTGGSVPYATLSNSEVFNPFFSLSHASAVLFYFTLHLQYILGFSNVSVLDPCISFQFLSPCVDVTSRCSLRWTVGTSCHNPRDATMLSTVWWDTAGQGSPTAGLHSPRSSGFTWSLWLLSWLGKVWEGGSGLFLYSIWHGIFTCACNFFTISAKFGTKERGSEQCFRFFLLVFHMRLNFLKSQVKKWTISNV